jgi:hypothetical protein
LTFIDSAPVANTANRVVDKLLDLQYGKERALLLFTQDPSGLGGQISRRLLGLKLALIFERKVVFPHLAEPPYGQVFEPLHSAVDYAQMAGDAVDFRSPTAKANQIVKMDFWDIQKDRTLYSKLQTYVPPDFAGSADPELHFTGALLSFCKLTEAMTDIVAQTSQRLGVQADTLGVHIRRGDKCVETPFIPIDIIKTEIVRLCDQHGFRRVFACSDDASVFEKLIFPNGIELIFDRTEARYNNANHRFLIRNPELAAEETRTAIKNIFLLGRCGAIVGQTNAHFARLAASQITFRNGGAPFGILIAGDHVLQHSRSIRLWYGARRVFRALGRRMLPGMTLRQMGRKLTQVANR